jgi:hypothetical protein
MSRKCHEYEYNVPVGYGLLGGKDNCCCSFPTLVILILIILQFSKRKYEGKNKQVDNSILFIIALFFLACCNPCKKW